MIRGIATICIGIAMTLILLLNSVLGADDRMTPTTIDIFTTIDQPIGAIEALVGEHPDIEVHLHKLDTITAVEQALSADLPADPDKAKHLALMRLQHMSKGTRSQLQRAATSLATAVQYGLEKYPAIVFDGEWVVYGLTDLSVALMHYRQWRVGETR